MSELENKQVGEVSEADSKKNYIEEMKAKVTALYAKADNTCLSATKSAKNFTALLDVVSRFPRYSENNVLLVYAQRPDATVIDSFDDWKAKGASVKKGAVGIHIVSRKDYTKDGKPRHYYYDESRFDISDVDKAEKPESKVYEEKLLMKALVHSAAARITVDADYPDENREGAYFDAKENCIHCQYGMVFKDMFTSIAKSAAHNELAGGDENYRISDGEFAARSVAYILAKKYGVSTDLCQIASVPATFQTIDAKQAKDEICKIINCARTLDGRMSEILDRPKEKVKEASKEATKEATKEGETKPDDEKPKEAEKQDKEDAR